jgi:hypothetical protein
MIGENMPARLTARSLKCTLVLDPAELALLDVPNAQPRMTLRVKVPDRMVTADVAAKSVRKCKATIAEHGVQAVAVVLQGKLSIGDVLLEAGLTVQIKTPKPAEAAA